MMEKLMTYADGLKGGTPYNIISYAAIDKEDRSIPFGRYFGIEMRNILYITGENLWEIAETPTSHLVISAFTKPGRSRAESVSNEFTY